VRTRAREGDEGQPDEAPEKRRMRLETLEMEEPVSIPGGSSRYAGNDRTVDVAEFFSPPRCASRARARKMVGGWSMDISHIDPHTGRKWDLANPKDVQAAWNLFYRTKPRLLVCSPPCTLFSQMQSLNGPADPVEWEQAVRYLNLCVAMCKAQQRAGRHFMFEHPAHASSWKVESLAELRNEPYSLEGFLHMCRFGMMAKDKDGVERPVCKPTRILTNCVPIYECLNRQCQGDHVHARLEGDPDARRRRSIRPNL